MPLTGVINYVFFAFIAVNGDSRSPSLPSGKGAREYATSNESCEKTDRFCANVAAGICGTVVSNGSTIA